MCRMYNLSIGSILDVPLLAIDVWSTIRDFVAESLCVRLESRVIFHIVLHSCYFTMLRFMETILEFRGLLVIFGEANVIEDVNLVLNF